MHVSVIDTLGMMTEINYTAPYEVQVKSIGYSKLKFLKNVLIT